MLIKKYTSQWIVKFERIKRELEKGLGDLDYEIEHIGSTSVPGLDAKDIIDIDIIYKEEHEFELIKTALLNIGYYHNGNQGIEEREVFKRIGKESHKVLDDIRHHLYVCPSHSEALQRHLLTRNALRRDKEARLKYQEMKYDLARKANQDQKVYASLKEQKVNEFLDELIEKEKLNRMSNSNL